MWHDLAFTLSKNGRQILTERFYSRGTNGQVTVREGCERASSRPLQPRLDLRNQTTVGLASFGEGFRPAHLAVALLADALGDDARAIRTHEHFSRRVVTLFPERWTITRSRILAYVAMIEQQTPANLAVGPSANLHSSTASAANVGERDATSISLG